MTAHRQSGFTLVELAIVLMIIGLLIGGVLRGQELMGNARLQRVINDITSYGAAINTFMDSYSARPGDLATASTRLPGCETGNSNSCRNGNGNGIIGAPVSTWDVGDQSIASENTQFWKHLAMAHLVSGVNPSASILDWGMSHPAAPLPGGYAMITTVGGGVANITSGSLVMQLRTDINTSVETNPAMSPKQAAYIDRKMDDGIPQTGDVQSRGAGNGADVAECEEVYDESREDARCGVSFVINR